jgi:hypothetical protein
MKVKTNIKAGQFNNKGENAMAVGIGNIGGSNNQGNSTNRDKLSGTF